MHAEVLDEPVACFLHCFREPQAGVGVVDDDSQGVVGNSVLTQSDFDDVVRRVDIDTQRTCLAHMRVLVGA